MLERMWWCIWYSGVEHARPPYITPARSEAKRNRLVVSTEKDGERAPYSCRERWREIHQRHADEQWDEPVQARTCRHNGSIAVRTNANKKTATAKANATERTRRCSNFPDVLAKKSTVANKTVFARY